MLALKTNIVFDDNPVLMRSHEPRNQVLNFQELKKFLSQEHFLRAISEVKAYPNKR